MNLYRFHARSLAFALAFPAAFTSTSLSAQDAVSQFGLARSRELAELGQLPQSRDVVVRDLLNYHRHRLPLPTVGRDVALELRFDRASAAPGDEVWLQVGYTTAPLGDRSLAPACAVALVVDCSGSMAGAEKMTAVKHGLHAFVDRLRADDEVMLVTFSTEARVAAPRQRRADGRWLHDAIDRLSPEANTNLHAGLMLGLTELSRCFGPTSRRVVLLTDGIANTGVIDPNEIAASARPHTGNGIDVTTIGVGQDLDVPLLQRLACDARGLFHFVADPQDVTKVFVNEADSLVATVARQVALSVELPRGLSLLQVPHDGVSVQGNRVDVRLADLNAGVTGVMLLRCRLLGDGTEALSAQASISFQSAAGGREGIVHAEAGLDRAAQ
ncbi:MAG: VWA domain-containing protein, partial [Planctomycetota bacterium]